jgi:hypothetical protein
MDTKAKSQGDSSEFEKFKDFAKKVISVPKKEIEKRDAEYKKSRKEKRPNTI